MPYNGWLLSDASKRELMDWIMPVYPDVIAHHVTLQFGADDMPLPAELAIVGHADDGLGVQALVVSVDGSTERPDGSTYHITWSIDRAQGRKPVHSNDVVRAGYSACEPMPIVTFPFVAEN